MYLKVIEGSKYPISFEIINVHSETIGTLKLDVDRRVSATVQGAVEGIVVSNIEYAMEWAEKQYKAVKLDEVLKLALEGRKIPAIGMYRKYVDPNATLPVAKHEVEKLVLRSMYDVQVYEEGKQAWSFYHPNTVPLNKGDVFERMGQSFKVTASDNITVFVEQVG